MTEQDKLMRAIERMKKMVDAAKKVSKEIEEEKEKKKPPTKSPQ